MTDKERIEALAGIQLDAGLDDAACAFLRRRGYVHAWGPCNCFDLRLDPDEIVENLSIAQQQTVEILEFFDINPYYARSQGTWVALTEDPIALERILSASEIPYKIIGHANDLKARTILNGESVRYLDRPQREELEKVML